jgi:hypothetical protein
MITPSAACYADTCEIGLAVVISLSWYAMRLVRVIT